jgi:hypothetical protein
MSTWLSFYFNCHLAQIEITLLSVVEGQKRKCDRNNRRLCQGQKRSTEEGKKSPHRKFNSFH